MIFRDRLGLLFSIFSNLAKARNDLRWDPNADQVHEAN